MVQGLELRSVHIIWHHTVNGTSGAMRSLLHSSLFCKSAVIAQRYLFERLAANPVWHANQNFKLTERDGRRPKKDLGSFPLKLEILLMPLLALCQEHIYALR
jgi:hypothetical protein